MKQSRKAIFIRHNGRVLRIKEPKASATLRRTKAALLSLPIELLQQIYSYLLVKPDPVELVSLRPPCLALVNRQLFHEAGAALFELDSFHLHVHLDHDPPSKFGLVTITNATYATLPSRTAPFEDKKAFITTHVCPSPLEDAGVTELFDKVRSKAFTQERLTANKPCRFFKLTSKRSTEGGQSWLKLLGDGIRFKEIQLDVFVVSSMGARLVHLISLRLKPSTKVSTKPLPKLERWQRPKATQASLDAAYAVAKHQVREIIDEVVNRGPPLGFTLDNIEAMIEAFDVREHAIDGDR